MSLLISKTSAGAVEAIGGEVPRGISKRVSLPLVPLSELSLPAILKQLPYPHPKRISQFHQRPN